VTIPTTGQNQWNYHFSYKNPLHKSCNRGFSCTCVASYHDIYTWNAVIDEFSWVIKQNRPWKIHEVAPIKILFKIYEIYFIREFTWVQIHGFFPWKLTRLWVMKFFLAYHIELREFTYIMSISLLLKSYAITLQGSYRDECPNSCLEAS